MGVSRDRLDLEMLMAEDESIAGLPPPPYPFPVPQWDLNPMTGGLGLFRPRRLETMCSAHKAAADSLKKRLEVMQVQRGQGRVQTASEGSMLCFSLFINLPFIMSI